VFERPTILVEDVDPFLLEDVTTSGLHLSLLFPLLGDSFAGQTYLGGLGL
jgi:hypothetical protein